MNNTSIIERGILPVGYYENPNLTYIDHKFKGYQNVNIGYSDDIYFYSITNPTLDGFPFQYFQLNVKNTTGKGFIVCWEGMSYNEWISDSDEYIEEIYIYLRNIKLGKWDEKKHVKRIYFQQKDLKDRVIYTEMEINITEYIDNKNNMDVIIIGPYGSGYGWSTVKTDYVALKWYI